MAFSSNAASDWFVQENLARLQRAFARKWEFIFMQAEAQVKWVDVCTRESEHASSWCQCLPDVTRLNVLWPYREMSVKSGYIYTYKHWPLATSVMWVLFPSKEDNMLPACACACACSVLVYYMKYIHFPARLNNTFKYNLFLSLLACLLCAV